MQSLRNRALEWDALLALTEQMLRAAESNEWEEVSALEMKRRSSLHVRVSYPTQNAQEQIERSSAIKKILESDNRILLLAKIEQGLVAEKLHSLQIGKRAQKAYLIAV